MKLTTEQREVYSTLYYRGPSTEAEIIEELLIMGVDQFLSELINIGLVVLRSDTYDVRDPDLSPAQVEEL